MNVYYDPKNYQSKRPVRKRRRIWRIWAKALGEKQGNDNGEADTVACVRTFIFLSYLITNCFIISGVIRHWN
jgi:hypothetical protein